ncbi:MAG: hypothetical protein ACK5NK_02185 [Niabella sp.]
MKRKTSILRKTSGLIIILLLLSSSAKTYAQACTFESPLVQVITSKDTVIGGVTYCKSVIDLSVDLDVNNGNKWLYIHLWTTDLYPSWSYNQAPTTSNVLDDNLLTIVLNNQNTSNRYLSDTYPPDGSEDVQGPADGVTFTSTLVSGTIYHFTFHNVVLLIPGACDSGTTFRGDSWSTQADNGKVVHCNILGYTFALSDPTVAGGIICGTPNVLDFNVTANGTGYRVDFKFDVYANTNTSSNFDPNLDTRIYTGITKYTIENGTATPSLNFNSTTMPAIYPAPYSTIIPDKYQDIYVVVKDIMMINGTDTTFIANDLITPFVNQCQALPHAFGTISAISKNGTLHINFEATNEENVKEYIVEASKDAKNWKAIGKLNSKAVDGNSIESLLYQFVISSPLTLGVVSLAFTLLLLPAFKSRLARGLLLIFVISGVILACTKNSKEVSTNKDTVYIRIAQYDKDGNAPIYSKIIKVVNQ